MHRGDTVARAVARAPFDATRDGPTCAAELAAHTSRGLAAFHATSSTSTARSGWLPRPTTTRTSPCSAAWDRGSGGDQALGCPSLVTTDRNHMPHALVRARNHSDSMRWRRHVESAKWGALSFDDADRTTRSRLSDPRTCYQLPGWLHISIFGKRFPNRNATTQVGGGRKCEMVGHGKAEPYIPS